MAKPRFADIKPKERFESGWNRLQILVEVLVGLIVIGGLAGVFGDGPLSPRLVALRGAPLQMGFERILRRTVPARIVIRATAPLKQAQLDVELPNELVEAMDIVATSPRPVAMRADRDAVVYSFELGEARLGSVIFTMKPRSAGFIQAIVRAGGGEAELRQLVLP